MRIPPNSVFLMCLVCVVACSPGSAAASSAGVHTWAPAEPYWLNGPQVVEGDDDSGQVASSGESGVRYYVVQSGDSLSMIAQRFGVTTESLANANGIADWDSIRIGQKLIVPVAGSEAEATATPAPSRTAAPTPTVQRTPAASSEPLIYVVQAGDSLSMIAQRYGLSTDSLAQANGITDKNIVRVGQRLTIPGQQANRASATAASVVKQRGTLMERLPAVARKASASSPFYRTTWVTYYGSPGVGVMGILGEFTIDDLVPKLRAQAKAYDDANGPDLSVRPAFHLIYGTATKAGGPDDTHLAFLSEELIKKYIDRAQKEGFGVILDVQIGNLSPLAAIKPAFKFLKYPLVELALDPEFAMVTEGQTIPGNPPGSITAAQINQVQDAMRSYMREQGIVERKILVVHQFLPSMIVNKAQIAGNDDIDVAICADGFGPPWPKISKYNSFMSDSVQFAGFKLFYRWDEPLMNERHTMGADPYPGIGYMEVTPSFVVYQ